MGGPRAGTRLLKSGKQDAEFYRGYQPHDRSLIPVAIVLVTLVALWLLIYLVSAVGPLPTPATVQSPGHSGHAAAHVTGADFRAK